MSRDLLNRLSCDVLIVGGGPAGSTCAWKLRQGGLDVVVLDRAAFPRDKLCAGWITPPVAEALALDLDDYARDRVLQPITRFRTALLGGAVVETAYDQPVSYGVRRCEFDHYLLERAAARLQTGSAVTSLRRERGQWIVNDRFAAPMLVGAGGHFCPVARHLNGSRRHEPVVAAQEVEFLLSPDQEAGCRVRPEAPELYFCPDLRGYGWCFRKGDVLNVGFGRQDRHRLAAHAREFLAFLRAARRIPDSTAERWPGHAYLLFDTAGRPLLDEGVLLAGDAAGLAYPESGEGIRTAVESGLLAADAIMAAAGRYSRERLQPYPDALARRFAPSPLSHALSRVVPAGLKRSLARPLLASRWFTRHVLLDTAFLHRGVRALA